MDDSHPKTDSLTKQEFTELMIPTKETTMITNKQVLEQGKLVQDYPIDYNPFTGEQESNGGVENLLIFDNKVYSVLTDFTGSIADANGEPSLVTDDADGFMKTMFFIDEYDMDAALDAEVRGFEQDYEDWQLDQSLENDWMRNDDW